MSIYTRRAASDAITDALNGHTAEADPHTPYQRESEKAAPGGYPSLDGAGYVPPAQLGSGTPNSTKVLAGDQSWRSLQLSWSLHATLDFANVDVSGASFDLGGATWTFANKANGTWSSDANGIKNIPNTSTSDSAAPRVYAPLSSLVSGLWTSIPEIVLVYEAPAVIDLTNGASGGTDYQTWTGGLGDTDSDPAVKAEIGFNSTAPSGQGAQSVRRASATNNTVKAALSGDDAARAVAIRVWGGAVARVYWAPTAGLAASDAMTGWTAVGNPIVLEAVNPNATQTALNAIFAATRGAAGAAFNAQLRYLRIYKRSAGIA